MSSSNGTSTGHIGTHEQMPVSVCTCSARVPEQMPAQCTEAKPADCHVAMPAQYTERGPERSEQSLRAESSYKHWTAQSPIDRPLVAPRQAHASALFNVMRDHRITIEACAETLGVDIRQVRKYLEASAPIPTTIDDALAREMPDAAADFAERRRALRGGSARTAADKFRAALTLLERDGASQELVMEGIRRLSAITPPIRGAK